MKTNKNNRYDESQRNSIRKKLVVVGDRECGKTSLLTVFSKNQFPVPLSSIPVYRTERTVTIDIEVDDKLIEMNLLDTFGPEDYDRIRPLSYLDADVFLICFSITNPVSLSNISEKWFPEVKHFCPNVPILLIGTKKDLRPVDAQIIMGHQIQHEKDNKKQDTTTVKWETGSQMGQAMKAFAYLECSAKTKEGVRDVFLTAARASLANKRHHHFASRTRCRFL